MFARLFAESGLSLDRLRALVEIGAAGGIAQAAAGDVVRQSQYSRQIKELEDFFRVKLLERQGKGVRLTHNGKELARISRFFLLGLSNFQKGCLAEERTYRIGASATFSRLFLVPVLAQAQSIQPGIKYLVEAMADDSIERRLHDLTLDFGVVTKPVMSRPLQLERLGQWRLRLWVPSSLCKTRQAALRDLKEKRLPLVLASESPLPTDTLLAGFEPELTCNTFLDARAALEERNLAGFLPDFLSFADQSHQFFKLQIPAISSMTFHYHLVWNPRLLRLNPQAIRRRDFFAGALSETWPMRGSSRRPAKFWSAKGKEGFA